MKTITMSYDEYNKMQDFAKQYAAKAGNVRPILEHVRVTFCGDTARADVLDGYKAASITLSITQADGEGEILLPVTGKLKKQDVFAIITEREKEVEVKTAVGARIHRRPEGDFPETENFFPSDAPREVFGFNPVLLADALKAFSGDKSVKIEYHGALKPIVITGSSARAIVLPMKI